MKTLVRAGGLYAELYEVQARSYLGAPEKESTS